MSKTEDQIIKYMTGCHKKMQIIPINFNANYLAEIKFLPIYMDYCLFQFDALNFFLGIRLHGGGGPT